MLNKAQSINLTLQIVIEHYVKYRNLNNMSFTNALVNKVHKEHHFH